MKLYTLILDRSGSMSSIWNEITTVVNRHLKEKSTDSLCSLLLFDTEGLDYLYKYQEKVTLLDRDNFMPRGGTPLRDAIGCGIDTIVKDWGDFLWQDFVEVEFVIFTDGEENSSRFWSSQDISRAITHFSEQYNWRFSFIGQGEQSDVENYAKQLGIKENIVSYTKSEELDAAFATV